MAPNLLGLPSPPAQQTEDDIIICVVVVVSAINGLAHHLLGKTCGTVICTADMYHRPGDDLGGGKALGCSLTSLRSLDCF